MERNYVVYRLHYREGRMHAEYMAKKGKVTEDIEKAELFNAEEAKQLAPRNEPYYYWGYKEKK